MPRPNRSDQFNSYEICIIHSVQRCVRKAFLAGVDQVSGIDYSYRKEWIRRRLESLASVFGIDVLTYSVMSNHLHLILRNRPDVVAQWSEQEVAIRWLRVFPGRRLEEFLAEPTESDVNMLVNQPDRIAEIRSRLSDISWFMRAVSEPIARLANKQENCTGRFWEGRFKAQRIVDEAGLLACAMYVDLNPIRAAMAESPDQAFHTSAYDRIQADKGEKIDSAAFELVPITNEKAGEAIRETPIDILKQNRQEKKRSPTGKSVPRDGWLAPLTLTSNILSHDPQTHTDGLRASDKGFLDLRLAEYLSLLRWTAQQHIEGSVVKVPANLQELLSRVGIDASMWRDLVWNFKKYFGRSSHAGSPSAMADQAKRAGKKWYRGQSLATECFAVL